ncbi:MAG: DUF488 family protein, partial [Candidatus Hodarchaeales archaeon]
GLTQHQIANQLKITQGRVSELMSKANKNIHESVKTVNNLNKLRKMEYKSMELDDILEVMHERNEEVNRRKKSLQGTIVPFSNKKDKTVFTIGYEKRKIDEFVKVLIGNGIDILVDIRANGYSRKPGFSHVALKKKLESEGVDYLYLQELGAPRD